MRLERAVVIGVMVACPLAATIAGYHLGSSGDWHAQAPIVSDPGVLPDFSALVAAYSSAVVNIAATQTVRASDPATGGDVIVRTEGSGFVVSPGGVILTSAHLVDHADTIVVTLTDRRQFNARVLGQDGESDVAVVDIDAEELPTVKLGESPFGLERTVTSGIVSATFRYLPEKPYVPFIQTDVPMNPGNSGGPLFNMKGDVVGINVATYSASGAYVGLSFAVPIDVAVKVKDRLLRNGRVRRGSLGVNTQDLPERLADFRRPRHTAGRARHCRGGGRPSRQGWPGTRRRDLGHGRHSHRPCYRSPACTTSI